MTFLDERITFDVQVGSSVADLPEKGVYTYQVVAEDYWSQVGYDVLFVGNFYYDKKFRQILDVTDIIRNSVGSHSTLANVLHDPYSLSQEQYYGNAISEYWVILTMQKDGATITRESSHKLVAKVYRYPNRSPYMILNGNLQFIDYSSNTFQNSYYTLTQGWKYSMYSKADWDQLALVPRYPCKNTENFGWAATFGYGNNVSSIPIYLSDQLGDWDYNTTLYTDGQFAERYNSTWISSLGSLLEDYFYNIEEHGVPFTDIDLYYTNNSNKRILIATFEACYSRYYLQWRDRFGGIQCQPFRDNITYSEDFNTEEVVSYTDKRRVSTISVQPKWKLYSGWIKNEIYPLYESIYTSPFLILYDTETNMNFEVMISDNKYTEKNYKNQKGLVNIELNLEAREKQNILY